MELLSGYDFEKLYALLKLPYVGGCGANFQNTANVVEDRICRDCSLTLSQALRMLNTESVHSKLYSKAYRWMMVFVNEEFKDTIK